MQQKRLGSDAIDDRIIENKTDLPHTAPGFNIYIYMYGDYHIQGAILSCRWNGCVFGLKEDEYMYGGPKAKREVQCLSLPVATV